MPSLRNWINYLEAAVKCVFIKSTNYEAQKTKKFRDQIGRIENMKYDRDEDCFICAEGRKLRCHKEIHTDAGWDSGHPSLVSL